MLGQQLMEVDLAFKVEEVSFDEFDRRNGPRENISLIEVQNKAFLAKIFNQPEEAQSAFGLGMVVNEVPFEQFERRKHPR